MLTSLTSFHNQLLTCGPMQYTYYISLYRKDKSILITYIRLTSVFAIGLYTTHV